MFSLAKISFLAFAGAFLPCDGLDAQDVDPSILAPTSLSRTTFNATTRAIFLSWADNSSDETGFVIEGSVDGDVWSILATPAAEATDASFTAAPSGLFQIYRAYALRGAYRSSYSNVISIEGTDPDTEDTDDDGMTDIYELLSDLNPYVDDGYEDADGDRYPNIFEFVKGTNPSDAQSTPVADFLVDSSTSLGGNNFTNLEAALGAVNASYQIIQVHAGVYSGSTNVNLEFPSGYPILLMSKGGASKTILDGEGSGSGLTVSTSSVVDGFTFQNMSATSGAAITVEGGSPLFINNVFRGNFASQYGAALYQTDGSSLIVHSTFLGNSATVGGSAVYVEGGSVSVTQSILWNLPSISEIEVVSPGTGTITDSIVRGGYAGSGNISSDPLLTPDGHLRSGSPAIDSGAMLQTALWDMDGEERPEGATTDLGADEFVDSNMDGLPNWWEALHEASGSTADIDGDGLSNLQEYEAGSDPRNYFSQGGAVITPTISILSGNNQTGNPDSFALQPLKVLVSSGGIPLNNAPVHFAAMNGVGLVSATGDDSDLVTQAWGRTNGIGEAQIYYRYPSTFSLSGEVVASTGESGGEVSVTFSEKTSAVPLLGLSLWLKADEGVTKDGAGKVSLWGDQSGAANNAAQVTLARQPQWLESGISGKPAIRFSGSHFLTIQDSSSLKPSAGITVLAVFKQNGTSLYQSLISRSYRNSASWSSPYVSYIANTFGASSSNYLRMGITVSGSHYQNNAANQYSLSAPHAATWVYDGTSQKVFRTGALVSNMSVTGALDYGSVTTSITIGSRSESSPGEYLNADVGEVIVYDRALTLQEQQTVERYLIAKYEIDEGDGIPPSYEVEHGLDVLSDDAFYDLDGDGVPNYWEYARGTSASDAEDAPRDWIVDAAHGADSATDNIVSTIAEAITLVPNDNGVIADSYKVIFVRSGTYAERIVIPSTKRIALVGEKGFEPPKTLGGAINANAIYAQGTSSIDGFIITRPLSAIEAGTVSEVGVYAKMAAGQKLRIGNCIITGHAYYGGIYNDLSGEVLVDHCTLVNNRGNGMSAYYSKMKVVGSIIWNEGATPGIWNSGAQISVLSSIIRGGGYGALTENPNIGTDGKLRAGSFAIDADSSGTALGGDIHGELRPFGSTPDIGADEWVDSDLDQLPDVWEINYFGDLSHAAGGDEDSDGLVNSEEEINGTNPVAGDTDEDGALDGAETTAGTNPLKSDTDGDGIKDGYELMHGLKGTIDDSFYDLDGDGVPNYWEYARGTSASDAADAPRDWIVDAAHGADSATDNIVSTIGEAITLVPNDNGVIADSYKAIFVRSGTYAERIVIPSTKRIALVGEKGFEPPKTLGGAINANAIYVQGTSSIDGFIITRPLSAIEAGTVSEVGVYAKMAAGQKLRIGNCIITGHAYYGGIYNDLSGEVLVDHCTLVNNRGNGMSAYYSKMKVVGSIIWNEGATPGIWNSGAQISVLSSIIRGGGYGALTENPNIGTDGVLRSRSGAIDADNSGTALGRDIHGESRPFGNALDIGADEWVDSDLDSLPDEWEMRHFGGLGALALDDPDNDNLKNLYENIFGFDPNVADSNGNGMSDFLEALLQERVSWYPPEWAEDEDGDGLTDQWEIYWGTSLSVRDTNGDGISDYASTLNGLDPLNSDQDGDGIENLVELASGTNPFDSDSDGDGVDDILDWYPLDPLLWDAPEHDPLDTSGPSIILFQPAGVVLSPL